MPLLPENSVKSRHLKGNEVVDVIEPSHLSSVKSLVTAFDAPDGKNELRLERKVGLFSGITLVMGTMIGSGIFVSPGNLLQKAQSPGLCIMLWIMCGFYSLLGAISYCEIGTLIPQSGGEYTYLLEGFRGTKKFPTGQILAFLYSWINVLLLKPSSLAIQSLSFAKYLLAPILPAIGVCLDSDLSFSISRLIAFVCISATRTQNIFTISKVTALVIIIGGGMYELSKGYNENLAVGFKGSSTSFGQIAEAFFGGIFAYSGWNNLNSLTEEIKNPYRNLPLAILIALPLTSIIYVLTNVSYLSVLKTSEIIASNAVGVEWANKVLGPASILIPIGIMTSVFGAANGGAFCGVRVSQVAAREGHLPKILSFLHIKRKTPIPSVLFNGVLAIVYSIPGDIGTLIDYCGFTETLFILFVMLALVVMRFTKKNQHRPIKVPIAIPLMGILISGFLVLGPIIDSPRLEYIYVLIGILAGLIVYVTFVHYGKTFYGLAKITLFLQKLLLVAPTTGHSEN